MPVKKAQLRRRGSLGERWEAALAKHWRGKGNHWVLMKYNFLLWNGVTMGYWRERIGLSVIPGKQWQAVSWTEVTLPWGSTFHLARSGHARCCRHQIYLARTCGALSGSRYCQVLMRVFLRRTDSGLDPKEAFKTDSHRSMPVFWPLPSCSHNSSFCLYALCLSC